MTAHQDKFLAARMLSGDRRAFDQFFEQNFDRLYRFALTRVQYDEDAAEEIVQQSLCKGLANLRSYRGEAALVTWFCKICRNSIADYYRIRNRENARMVQFEDSEEIRASLESLAAMPTDDPQRMALNDELRRLIQLILDHLPGRYGEILEWKYIHGYSVVEIAGQLGVSAKAAESSLTRARVAFRQEYVSLTDNGTLSPAF